MSLFKQQKTREIKDIYWFRPFITKYTAIILFWASLFGFFYGMITGGPFYMNVLILVSLSFISNILVYFERIEWAANFILVGGVSYFLTEAFFIRSGYAAVFIALFIVISGIIKDNKFTGGLSIAILTTILAFAGVGRLEWGQKIDVETGVGLVNHIATLLPLIIAASLLSLIMNMWVIGTLEIQERQQKLIQKTQEQLLEQEKGMAIKVLAGGIAHDLKNMLSTIKGHTSLLKMMHSENPDLFNEAVMESLSDIGEASMKANQLSSQLVHFARNMETEVKLVDKPAFLIKKSASFALKTRDTSHKLAIRDDLPPIKINELEFAQIMMNLLINADEAQKSKKGDLKGEKGPHQDSILLKAEPILGKDTRKIIRSLHSPSKFKEKLNILPNHTYLHLIIMDHGVGIKEKDKEMVFAPFYTKKEHGTGLGLVICASLVKKMNGLIGFTSKFGDGTKFHLFIPEVLKKE